LEIGKFTSAYNRFAKGDFVSHKDTHRYIGKFQTILPNVLR